MRATGNELARKKNPGSWARVFRSLDREPLRVSLRVDVEALGSELLPSLLRLLIERGHAVGGSTLPHRGRQPEVPVDIDRSIPEALGAARDEVAILVALQEDPRGGRC